MIGILMQPGSIWVGKVFKIPPLFKAFRQLRVFKLIAMIFRKEQKANYAFTWYINIHKNSYLRR